MPKITYVLNDGSSVEVDVEAGANVMRTAFDNGVPGIVAECGGAAMCATCHVYVDAESLEKFPQIGEVEEEMLECTAAERSSLSRLSCQLHVPEGVSSITVRIPEKQN